ncbi:MAG: hypothetical protein K6B28_00160 [Lachnospiraceae bacterium]|nr:hypothetical protein [Lachnospiraceae bacterium]
MNFLSLSFAVLMFILCILLYFIRSEKTVKYILLIAGYIFYSGFSLPALAVLIILSVFTWVSGYLISKKKSEKEKSRMILVKSVVIQLLVLLFFKYVRGDLMPVGLSFYLLMAISYLVDMYRGDIKDDTGLIDAMIFIGFFPMVVSGPVMKAKEFLPQLSSRRPLTKERLSYGIQLFALGAFEKLVIADRLSVAVNSVYKAPLAYSGGSLFFTSLAYTLQLFFDFSGYSNMAVATASILGFELTKNFDLPYIAKNPSDFWRRWHISLSSWLKEYVYIPLGGNRLGKGRTYLNLFLTMIVSGLWHGSTLNFFLWGALHGVGSVVHRFFVQTKKEGKHNISIPPFLSGILNFFFVSFLWIPFRAENLSDSWIIFKRIITLKPGVRYYYVYTWIFLLLLLVVEGYALLKNNGRDPFKPLSLEKMSGKVIFSIFLILTAVFAYFGSGAFIYAGF